MRRLVTLVATVVVLLCARFARAGEIEIRTLDGTPWPQLVQQIQDDVATRGRVFSVVVLDGSTPIPCGAYELRPDAVTAAAFEIEGCDRATNATALALIHREALFEPGEIVPRARKASIAAYITRRGSAEGGGAAPVAGSKVWCTVALQPYLWDGLRGEPTPLSPDRFVLKPIEAYIHAAPDGSGWIARGEAQFDLRFHYEVDDIHTGKKVLENEATLACADAPTRFPTDADMSAYDAWKRANERRSSRGESPPDMSAFDAWQKANGGPLPGTPGQAPPWWVALDFPGPVTSAVGTVLIRPVSDIVLPGGVRGSSIYGGGPAVYGGSTAGVSWKYGNLFLPVRLTLAGDSNAFVVSTFVGLGGAWDVLPHTSVYMAPAFRYTGMVFSQGMFSQTDGALVVGIRRRFWTSKHCTHPVGGIELLLEAAAPIASSGVWMVSGGFSSSWGRGGSYPYIAAYTRCKK